MPQPRTSLPLILALGLVLVGGPAAHAIELQAGIRMLAVTDAVPGTEIVLDDGGGGLQTGIADAFGFNGQAGWYDDNVGGYETSYTIIPAPGSLAAAGLVGLLAARRRRA